MLSTPTIEKSKVLDEAKSLAHGDRQTEYGDIYENYENIRKVLSAIAPHLSLASSDICLVLLAVKLGRNVTGYKRDSIVDAVNYLDFYAVFKEYEQTATQAGQLVRVK